LHCLKADPSLKSFLFSLKNPHNWPESKFPLKDREKESAIICNACYGPCFSDNLQVYDNCNTNTGNSSCVGPTCERTTFMDAITILTGSQYFIVKEIEVFEIAG
jgi:hypothetical protein